MSKQGGEDRSEDENEMADQPKPGEAQVYEFTPRQYGTSWYHGHLSLQCESSPNAFRDTPLTKYR